MTRRALARGGAAALLLAAPRAALAHPGGAFRPHDLWHAWSSAPVPLIACALAVWLYARGLRALGRNRRRPAGRRAVVPVWRRWCWAGAWLALLVALASPLDALSGALFAAHMVQHLLLMMVAAPLFVLGDPAFVTLWALPLHARREAGRMWRRARWMRALWRVLATPAVAWMLHVGVLWIWHTPALYDRALATPPVHLLEHATFFGTAALFWWVVLAPRGRRTTPAAAIPYLFGAALQSTMLGAVIALARHPLYTAHFSTTRAWGLTPLQDQQLAGLLMWVPAGLVYLAALVPVALRLLRRPDDQRVGALAMAGVSARGTP
jgi:cytochrome c oxidase assembly factor CtaG